MCTDTGGGGESGRKGSGASLETITDWNPATMSHFEKNFYQEHPAVTAMTAEQVAEFRRSKQIVVCHNPMSSGPARTRKGCAAHSVAWCSRADDAVPSPTHARASPHAK